MNRTIVEDLSALHRDILLRSEHAPGDWCNGFDTASRVYAEAVQKLLHKHVHLAMERGMVDPAMAAGYLAQDSRQLSFHALGFEVVEGVPDGVVILSNGRGQHVIAKLENPA